MSKSYSISSKSWWDLSTTMTGGNLVISKALGEREFYLESLIELTPSFQNSLIQVLSDVFDEKMLVLARDYEFQPSKVLSVESRRTVAKEVLRAQFGNDSGAKIPLPRKRISLIRCAEYLLIKMLLDTLGLHAQFQNILKSIKDRERGRYFHPSDLDETDDSTVHRLYASIATSALASGLLQSKPYSLLSYRTHFTHSEEIVSTPNNRIFGGTVALLLPLRDWLEFLASYFNCSNIGDDALTLARWLYFAPEYVQQLLYANFMKYISQGRVDRFAFTTSANPESTRLIDYYHAAAMISNERLSRLIFNEIIRDKYPLISNERVTMEASILRCFSGSPLNREVITKVLLNNFFDWKLLFPEIVTSFQETKAMQMLDQLEEQNRLIDLNTADANNFFGSFNYMTFKFK